MTAASNSEARKRAAERAAGNTPTFGYCTACGSIEVELVDATGTRDFSGIGEPAAYPTGYGCEVCA